MLTPFSYFSFVSKIKATTCSMIPKAQDAPVPVHFIFYLHTWLSKFQKHWSLCSFRQPVLLPTLKPSYYFTHAILLVSSNSSPFIEFASFPLLKLQSLAEISLALLLSHPDYVNTHPSPQSTNSEHFPQSRFSH